MLKLNDGDSLIKSYLDWLKDEISIAEINDYIELTTPFLDRHNDRLQIYITRKNTELILTDDGCIIGDLIDSGCDLSTPRRAQQLNIILNGYGITRSSTNELIVKATEKDFPRKKHLLLQAMLAVNDLFLTTYSKAKGFFLDDVYEFFVEQDISFNRNIQVNGRSGFSHNFDFVLPQRGRTKPERLIRALNNPTVQSAQTFLFAITDLSDVRSDSQFLTILNDSKPIPSKVLSAFDAYKAVPILWSDRMKIIDLIA